MEWGGKVFVCKQSLVLLVVVVVFVSSYSLRLYSWTERVQQDQLNYANLNIVCLERRNKPLSNDLQDGGKVDKYKHTHKYINIKWCTFHIHIWFILPNNCFQFLDNSLIASGYNAKRLEITAWFACNAIHCCLSYFLFHSWIKLVEFVVFSFNKSTTLTESERPSN